MRSSYKQSVNYGDVIKASLFGKNCKNIVEIGILDGFSLQILAETGANVIAYDIFDDFIGNHAIEDQLRDRFSIVQNVQINYGDFYYIHEHLIDNSLDILHIDIANNGHVIEFMFHNYIKKMKRDGIIIIEGGSLERDNIEWMIKYDKLPIKPTLERFSDRYDILTIGTIPSITFIKQKV